MKKILITPLILFCSVIAYGQHSYKQKLGDIATITFPSKPKIDSDKTKKYYQMNFGGINYFCQTFPENNNLAGVFTRHANDSLYATFIRASINKFDGKLFYKKDIVSNGLRGVEYGYKAMNDSVYYYRYRQIFCLNHVFIMNGLSSSDSLLANSSETRAFFKSFRLNIAKSDIQQDGFADVIFSGRFAFYLATTIVSLALFITLVVYIIKKITYRKTNE